MRILLIEEDTGLLKKITNKLIDAGFLCDSVDNLKDGEYYFDIRHYALVIVSWNLDDSKTFVRDVSNGRFKTPVIAISSCGDSEDEIEALHKGADGYWHKSYDIDVLLARVKARLRISNLREVIKIEELVVNTKEESISYNDRKIDLTGKVFDVFAYLAMQHGTIVSKEQLLDALWVDPDTVTPNVIDVAINRIRQNLDKRMGIISIETVRRRGYRFCYPSCQ